jgi:hypothetical protein
MMQKARAAFLLGRVETLVSIDGETLLWAAP